MPLSDGDFEFVRALVLKRAAIVLDVEKRYLADSRLSALTRREGLRGVEELMARLRGPAPNGLTQKVIEAMTTNETSFFRDVHPFEALRTVVLPELIRRRAAERRLDIWCAAASSGQEPYSLAILLKEHFPVLEGWTVNLVATDLSTEMLDRCRQARYNQIEVNRGLSAPLLGKYFTRDGLDWRLKDEVRVKLVEFRPLNLIDPWPGMTPKDVVLIRNVLIYFDVPTKRTILGKVRQLLRPDGYLFLGGAETTFNLDDGFERTPNERSGCYRLRAK